MQELSRVKIRDVKSSLNYGGFKVFHFTGMNYRSSPFGRFFCAFTPRPLCNLHKRHWALVRPEHVPFEINLKVINVKIGRINAVLKISALAVGNQEHYAALLRKNSKLYARHQPAPVQSPYLNRTVTTEADGSYVTGTTVCKSPVTQANAYQKLQYSST